MCSDNSLATQQSDVGRWQGPVRMAQTSVPQRCCEPSLQCGPETLGGSVGSSANVAGHVRGLGEGSKGQPVPFPGVGATPLCPHGVSRRLAGCCLPACQRVPGHAQLLGEAAKCGGGVGPRQVLVRRPHSPRLRMIYEEGSDSLTSAPAGLSGRFRSLYFISKSADCPSP